MTTTTKTFPPGAFSYTIPSTLAGTTMQVTVVGGPGAGSGGKGGRLTAVMPVTAGDVITGTVASGSAGAHSGGSGSGGWGHGGGSTSLLRNGTKYAEAGGGGGAGEFGAGGSGGGPGTPSGSPGSNFGTAATAGTGGVAGATAGNGGNGSGVGGAGGGGGGAGPGGGASGAVGPGAFATGGGGASFAHSALTSVVYHADGTSAYVSVTYALTTAPASPTLTYPIPNSYADPANTIIHHEGIYNPVAGSGPLEKVTLRFSQDGAAYGYWNGTDFSSSTPVWVVPTSGAGVGAGGHFNVAIPAGLHSNGHTDAWSFACQEATAHLQGAFAHDIIFQATVIPTTAITSPSGDINSIAPTVTWTATFSGSDVQVTAQIKVVSKAVHDAPGFSWGGVVSPVYNSGQVTTAVQALAISSSADINNGDQLHVGLIVSQTGGAFSQWSESAWTVVLVGPDTPALVAVGDTDGTTGAPIVDLTAIWSGTGVSASSAQFQASYGTTWADVGAGTAGALSAVAIVSDQASGVDQWAPFGVAVLYRARLASTVSGQLVTSDWSAIQTVTLPSTDWWLMAADDPTTAMLALRAGSGPGASAVYSMTINEHEKQGLFEAFGRDTYITVHGTMMQEEFDLSLMFFDQPSYDQFVSIRRLQTTVLIKSTDEGQLFYVSLGATRPTLLANLPEPIRHRYITIHCSPVTP
jgi:hypothetical protein